ncbi:MAG: J domain-containing protein [Planctomycetes bacterium]|nr:J domain-containing protein [Planctomycetota bacterium]
MSDGDEPRWELLPYDPQGFFQLEDGFDRKELKRRYNALIRRYKPEKAPAEFQRIRAAYEALDGRLRYGQAPRPPMESAGPAFDWSQIGGEVRRSLDAETEPQPRTDRPRPRDAGREPPTTRMVPLLERLKTESPRKVYDELRKSEGRSPFDYYSLAVLSDVVTDKPLTFVKWLLAGLKAHPGEPGLFNLLYQAYRGEVPAAAVPDVLIATAAAVPGDRFYYLTEPLWDRLLKADFAIFRRTLEKCEARLLDHRIEGRLTFYLHIARRALWVADDEWLDATFRALEEHHDVLPPWMEFDLELAFALREYRRAAAKVVGGHPLRLRIDRAIREYCESDGPDADRAVIECQLDLAAAASDVLEAFPVGSSTSGALWQPWSWISAEVAERVAAPEPPVDDEELERRTYRFLRTLEDGTPSLVWNIGLWIYGAAFLAGLAVLLVGPFVLVWRWLPQSAGTAFLGVALSLASVAGFLLWLKDRTLQRGYRWFLERMAGRVYHRRWRHELVRFLNATQFPLAPVDMMIRQLAFDDEYNFVYSTWVAVLVPADCGVAVLQTARRFVV